MTSEDPSPLGSASSPPPRRGCFSWLIWGCLFSLFLLPLHLAGQYFGYLRPRGGWDSEAAQERSRFRRCCLNLQQLDAALRRWAADHDTHFPSQLDELVRSRYLDVLPTCPSHPGPAYTNYRTDAKGLAYHVACLGDHHRELFRWRWTGSSANLPRISSEEGLLTEPDP